MEQKNQWNNDGNTKVMFQTDTFHLVEHMYFTST